MKQAPIKKDYTLEFFEGLGRIGKGIGGSIGNFKKVKRYREILLMLSIILIGLISFFVFSFATRPNGFDVYVDGENLGLMRWDRGALEPEYLATHIVQRIKTHHSTEIFPVSEIYATPVRVRRNDDAVNFDTMVNMISQRFDYNLTGGLIIVNGERVAFLNTQTAAVELIASIIESFSNEYTTGSYLMDDVVVSSALLSRSEIMTQQASLLALTTPRVVQQIHIAQRGDNLYNIAIMYGMSLNSLVAANPHIDPDAFLGEGAVLTVLPNIPILSVRTYERVTLEEYIDIDGQNVLARIVADVTKVNGTEVSRQVLSAETIR